MYLYDIYIYIYIYMCHDLVRVIMTWLGSVRVGECLLGVCRRCRALCESDCWPGRAAEWRGFSSEAAVWQAA